MSDNTAIVIIVTLILSLFAGSCTYEMKLKHEKYMKVLSYQLSQPDVDADELNWRIFTGKPKEQVE